MSQHMHAALPSWSMELVKLVQPPFGIGKCMMYLDESCLRLCLRESYLIALTLLVGERPV